MTNADKIKVVVLVFVSIGAIVVAAPTWASLATPAAVGGALVAVGSVLGAVFGVNTKV